MMRRVALSALFSLMVVFAAFAGGSSDTGKTDAVSSASEQTGGAGGPGDGNPPGPPPDGTMPGTPPSGAPSGGPGMQATAPASLQAVYALSGGSASKDGVTFSSTDRDISCVYVNGAGSLSLSKATITKRGDTTSEDESNFYGLNAAVVAAAGSSISLSGSTITTSSEGSNAVFSTGAGSKISVSNLIINTTSNSSRGLDATYGGTVIGDNVTITTAGAHCAALATDRGEGTVSVTNSKGRTSGDGSPGIYSTGTISATNSSFSAAGSEAAVVEGKNSITLKGTDVSGAKRCGVMIYQSFSGDAGTGTGTFTMSGGTLTAGEGPMFYVTNTDALIKLESATLKGGSGILLAVSPDRWGTTGSNGGKATLNAVKQTLAGSVSLDKTSSVSLSLASSSSFSGAVNAANSAGSVTVSLDGSSTWKVTGDSHVSVLSDADAKFSNVSSDGFTVYYDAANKANSALGGKTYALAGGGKIAPEK